MDDLKRLEMYKQSRDWENFAHLYNKLRYLGIVK